MLLNQPCSKPLSTVPSRIASPPHKKNSCKNKYRYIIYKKKTVSNLKLMNVKHTQLMFLNLIHAKCLNLTLLYQEPTVSIMSFCSVTCIFFHTLQPGAELQFCLRIRHYWEIQVKAFRWDDQTLQQTQLNSCICVLKFIYYD